MLTHSAYGASRLSFWLRVREFAVPASVIETATARRRAGDWAGACAAAGIDVDLNLRSVARTHGRELASRIRGDLRRLAPDLLRWHMPRIAPEGLLRPGLTISLAQYHPEGRAGGCPVHLVARTAPAWASAGQRISLAVWDASSSGTDSCRHPHPRPHRRFRLDLHRHLWDAQSSDELRTRSGADRPPVDGRTTTDPDLLGMLPHGADCAVDRWAAEAGLLLQAEGRAGGPVTVRVGGRQRLVLDLDRDGGDGPGPPTLRISAASGGGHSTLPVLPDAATWVPPDLVLIRAGLIEADRLHPLVASALVPGHSATRPPQAVDRAGGPRVVECRGARHGIGLVGGVLVPLDHDPAEIRREELLAALTGTPLPCLQAIDEAHRRPQCLADVRARLDHGDTAGALAVVEHLLGPDALLRGGALRDELAAAAEGLITQGLFRAGLAGPGPGRLGPGRPRPRDRRSHPRHASTR